MQVMCIDDDFPEGFGDYHPKLWDVVTVIDYKEQNGIHYYALLEYPDTRFVRYWYGQDAFTPLWNMPSDMIENMKEERMVK